MWDDYGVIRPGRMPLDVYENGQIVFTQNPISADEPVGVVAGTMTVANATPKYVFSISPNPYFSIKTNQLVVKGQLSAGVLFVNITAIKGFKRIVQAVRIVVSDTSIIIVLDPAPGWTIVG
jgi:hypothetical protein